MNANLRRVTFVLDLEAAEAFRYISQRTGTSQSAIMREVVSEPIRLLAQAMKGVPAQPNEAQLDLFRADMVRVLNGAIVESRDVLGPDVGVFR